MNVPEGDCSLIIRYLRSHNIWNRIVDDPDLVIILPNNTAVLKFASSLGLEVDQLFTDVDFVDIVLNHFGHVIPDPEADPDTYETFKTINGGIITYDDDSTDHRTSVEFYTGSIFAISHLMWTREESDTQKLQYANLPRTGKTTIDEIATLSGLIAFNRIYVIDEVLFFDDQLEKIKSKYPFLTSPVKTATSAFNILDVHAVYNIFVNLNPESVVKACQTDQRFSRWCNNEDLFRRLLAAHYSDHEIQRGSAVHTYKSIVNGTYMYYIVLTGRYNYVQEVHNTEFISSEAALRILLLNDVYNRYKNIFGNIDMGDNEENLLELIDEHITPLGIEVVTILKDITLGIADENEEDRKGLNFFDHAETARKEFIDRVKETDFYKLPLKSFSKLIVDIDGNDILDIYRGYQIA